MPHICDPNGAIKAYRREQDRRDRNQAAAFGLGVFTVFALAVAGVFWTLSILGR